jgi:hypothetical protein
MSFIRLRKKKSNRSQWPRGLRCRHWSLGCWDRGFESHLRNGCLSSFLCCVVLSCAGTGFCDGTITHPMESSGCLHRLRNLVSAMRPRPILRTVKSIERKSSGVRSGDLGGRGGQLDRDDQSNDCHNFTKMLWCPVMLKGHVPCPQGHFVHY